MADLKAALREGRRREQEPAREARQHHAAEDLRAVQAGHGGDVDGKRPGFADMVGRAKWDAWNGVKGKSADDAMQEYVDLIESLK